MWALKKDDILTLLVLEFGHPGQEVRLIRKDIDARLMDYWKGRPNLNFAIAAGKVFDAYLELR